MAEAREVAIALQREREVIAVTFPAPDRRLSLNDRMCWQAQKRISDEWMNAAQAARSPGRRPRSATRAAVSPRTRRPDRTKRASNRPRGGW